MSGKSLIITNKQVKENMTVEKAIECVENTWRWHGEGKVVMPSKITTDMSSLGVGGWFNSMPSYIQPENMAGLKLVGGYINNPSIGLPFIRANVMLTDPNTGTLKALMCGDWISDVRTGAQPAIAMKYLAAKTDVITIIGAGVQAYYAILCISKIHKIKEVRVCDIRPEAREKFAAYFPEAEFKFVPYEKIEDACNGSDVIITLTTADAPLVDEAWCAEGCLLLTMGSFTEIADNVPQKFDKIFIDHTGQGMHRGSFKSLAERGIIKAEDIMAELPEILTKKKNGRTNSKERIVCEIVGMGSPDLTIAAETYKNIISSGVECVSVDMMG